MSLSKGSISSKEYLVFSSTLISLSSEEQNGGVFWSYQAQGDQMSFKQIDLRETMVKGFAFFFPLAFCFLDSSVGIPG